MSYDLAVFEPSSAPRGRAAFLEWYGGQTRWEEPHGYCNPAVASPNLRRWYEAMVAEFPNMNGPDVSDDDFSSRHSDYSIGTNFIYASFAWSEAEDAYEVTRGLSVAHGVGFYDVSGDDGDGEIYFPGDELRPPSQGGWRRIAAEFRAHRV